jgi:hypothetical protein
MELRLWYSPELIRLCARPAEFVLPVDEDGRDFLPNVEMGCPNGSSLSMLMGIASSETAFFDARLGRSASVAARARRG